MAQKVVTILKFEGNSFWQVRFEGEGIPTNAVISTERLEHLVEEGYAIEDPKHLIDQYGPESMCEEEVSSAEMDGASAYGDRNVTVRVQWPDWRAKTG